MNIKAFAKINLALKVLNQRDDGYHNIESILLPLEMHDVIEIKIDNLAADDFVTCDDFCLKTVKYNLCHKVIDEARKKWGFTKKLRISIHKNIFIQAGLGGGSADAAATLIGIIKLFKIKPTREELIDLSIKIGSDVPWSLFSQPAIIEQKGEKIDFINFNQQYYCLLVKPAMGLSTKEVFDKFDEIKLNNVSDNKKTIKEIANSLISCTSLKELNKICYNELELSASQLLPEIIDIKNKLIGLGFDFVQMTGAGSTVFALTTNLNKAKQAEEYFSKNENYQIELTKTRVFNDLKREN